MNKLSEFEKDIADVLKKHGVGALVKTHDEVLAIYVTTCIAALRSAKVAHSAHDNA